MNKQTVPKPIKRAVNETAHLLAQQRFTHLRQELLADAMDLFYADTPIDDIVQAVRRKAFAKVCETVPASSQEV